MKITPQSVTLLYATPNAAKLIEQAGRTCYKSEASITDESADAFVRMLIRRGHESVLEHATATVRVIADRGVSHELVRHRGGGLWPDDHATPVSYSQESTRYCNYGSDRLGGEITVVEPPWAPGNNAASMVAAHDVWKDACEYVDRAYMKLLALGQPPQLARSVLPTGLKTEVVTTANLRDWRHFLKQRLAPAAHPQMREVARLISKILSYVCLPAFEDILADEKLNA